MRKIIALVVASLALVAMVSAYSSATVTNEAHATVVRSDNALIGLIAGPGTDANAYYNGSELEFDFDRGLAGVDSNGNGKNGLQSNSTYTWVKALTVKNNSNDPMGFYITQEGLTSASNMKITVQTTNLGTNRLFVYNNDNSVFNPNNAWPWLTPGQEANIEIIINTDDNATLGTLNQFNLKVYGLQSNS